MNRIQHLVEHFGSLSNTSPAIVEAGKFNSGANQDGPAIFAPLHYEANYAYPLIVWLHGPYDDERQLKRIMPLVSMRNYVAVGPRGTVRTMQGTARLGFGWAQSPEHIALAEQRVLSAVEVACQRFNIAPTRIYLAGFGCGGTMAFRLALSNPELFAGALSLAGPFPAGHTPLARLAEARRLRLFLASGRDSETYPPQIVCDNLRLFHTAGMSVSLRQYPCGDELTTNMLADVDRWIMDQLTAPAPANQDSANRSARGS